MSGIPDAVRAEAARRRASLAETHNLIRRGELRVAHPVSLDHGGSRLVLVLSIDSENEFAEVLLVHSAPEFATDQDAVLPGESTGAQYAIVVETDLRSIVWTLQLGKVVGYLDTETMIALGSVGAAEGERCGQLETGLQLAGRLDGRWEFKRSEGDALRRLSADCTSALLDSGMVWMIDPRLLRPELLDAASDPAAVIFELFHWFSTRETTIANEDLEFAVDVLASATADTWGRLGDIGLELVSSFAQLLERALAQCERPSDRTLTGFLSMVGLDQTTDPGAFGAFHQLGRQGATVA